MKQQIIAVSVERNMQVIRGRGDMWKNTCVSIHRGNKVSQYHTNPIIKCGKISEASVTRAKRAQMKLIELANLPE